MTNKSKLLLDCGNKLSKDELLAALAEECVELSHAALKYRRALTQDNPTPAKEKECLQSFEEEISDVMNILVSAGAVNPELSIESYCSESKAVRWMNRLNDQDYSRRRRLLYRK